MKKLLGTVLVAIMVMFVVGCTAPAPSTAPAPKPTPAPAPAPVQKLAPTAEKPLELKFAYHAPVRASLVVGILQPWAEDIVKASNGRIKITHYGGETLVKSADAYDAVVSGVCDIAVVDPEENAGRFPLTGVNILPFIYPTTTVAGRVSHEILNKYCINTELEEVKLLITAPLHQAQIFSRKKVEVLEDFTRVKWRAAGKIESWTVDALGAVPVDVMTGDVNGALDRGMVQGCFATWSAGLSFGWKDVTQFRTECDIFPRVFLVVMNKQLWDRLPDDLQKVIAERATPEVSQKYAAEHEKLAAGAKGGIVGSDRAAGKPPVYVLPKEERERWVKTVAPVLARWVEELSAKNLPAKAVLDEANSLSARYSQAK